MKSAEGSTISPDISLFKKFQKQWQNIKQSEFRKGIDGEYVVENIGDLIAESLDFAKTQLLVYL